LKGLIKVKRITIFLILITILVITIGGTIRIYDAGESCPDWPTCFGTWGFDISESEQTEWYEQNPGEIDSRGSWHRYSTFQIFTEWIHRFLAGIILGPLVIVNWLLAKRNFNDFKDVRFATSVSLILIIWQGLVGMLTVKMDNENWSVVLHLGSALAFMLSLIWTWMIISRRKGANWFSFDVRRSEKWKNKILFMSLITLLTLFSGTLVSTTPGANTGCGVSGFHQSWPLCHNKFSNPITNIIAQSQLIHRWFVALVGIILSRSTYSLFQESNGISNDGLLKRTIFASTAIYVINILLGGLYILSWTEKNLFIEILSLIHLILASSSFLLIASAYLGILIVQKNNKNEILIPED
jgi:heme A synthase